MELFGLMYLFLYLLGCHGEKAKNKTTIVNVKTKGRFVVHTTYCKCLGGKLIRKKTLKIHLTCLKQFLDTFHQYWIGTDHSKSEQKYRTFSLNQNKEPKFEAKRSGFNMFSSLCEVVESTYMNNRNPCKLANKTSLMTCSMSDDNVMTTAYQKELTTDASNTDRTIFSMSSAMEQSYDDGPSVELIICVVCLLMATFAIVLTVVVKKRRKRKGNVKSKKVPHDPNILKPTEMVPIHESDSEHNHMLDDSPYAEIKGSVTEMVPVPVSDSTLYHILEESPCSEIKGSGAENCGNHQASECPDSPIRDNKDETYDHLERNRSERRHGSEVDVAHPEIDNASESLLEDCCEVKTEKDYDHLELKEQSSNMEEFSEYNMTDDATRINKDETYDHLERNRSESRHGSEVDVAHSEIDNASEALLKDSCEVQTEKDYDHLELKVQSSNMEVFSEYSMTDDADYTDLSKRKPLENPCSDYDHANLN